MVWGFVIWNLSQIQVVMQYSSFVFFVDCSTPVHTSSSPNDSQDSLPLKEENDMQVNLIKYNIKH